MPAELPLVPSATLLAASALLFLAPTSRRLPHLVGTALVAAGAATPLALTPFVDPLRAGGRALWRWSAVGGPTIEASYRLDPLAVVSLACVVAFTGAALALAGRAEHRHVALGALILALGFVAMALVVTSDAVAAVVVLAVLASLTILALFAVSPVSAMARAAAHLAIGVQSWVLGALLISRSGSATFLLSSVPAASVSDGAILAATVGALLCAGLYPAVAWDLDDRRGMGDVGPLGALIAMPIGIGATTLLIRLLAASGRAADGIALPEVGIEMRLGAVLLVLLAVSVALAASRALPVRPIAVGAAAIVLIGLMPQLHWSALVIAAAVLTTGYAAAVSLALPDHWETVRPALALVALWIAVASGSPLGVAGATLALGARAIAALASSLWLVPHRDYLAFVAASAAYLVGVIAVAVGALASASLPYGAAGLLAATLLALLELAHVARRFRVVRVPVYLDVITALVALGVAMLGAAGTVLLEAALARQLGRAAALSLEQTVAIGVGAGVLVVLARTVRPLLETFEAAALWAGPPMRALDPEPVAVGAFRAIETATTRGALVFGLLERRAGVAVSAALIAALLFWAVR